VSGLARGIDGAAHEGALHHRHGGGAGRRGRRHLSAGTRRPARRASPQQGADRLGEPARPPRPGPRLPSPQPADQRPLAGGGGGRGRAEVRLPDHRPAGRPNRGARCWPCRARRWIPRARGTNDLLRQGATVCEGAEDVLRALEGLGGLRERERRRWSGPAPPPPEGLRERVEGLLSPTPVTIDDLVRAAAAPAVSGIGRAGGAVAGRSGGVRAGRNGEPGREPGPAPLTATLRRGAEGSARQGLPVDGPPAAGRDAGPAPRSPAAAARRPGARV
jgi:DNA processing protein